MQINFEIANQSKHELKTLDKEERSVLKRQKNILKEAKHLLRAILFYPMALFRKNPNSIDLEEGHLPVIFVHGYLHNSAAAYDIEEDFKKEGLGPVYSLTLFPSIQDIKKSAQKVNLLINRVKQAHPEKKIIVIGHSMGGLVSSYCLEEMRDEGEIEGVITLGSPLHGTKLARIGIGKAAKQMKIGSEFLKELTDRMKNSTKTKYYNFGGDFDEIVIPNKNAFLYGDGRDSEKTFEGVGHVGLLYDQVVRKELVNQVKSIEQSSC